LHVPHDSTDIPEAVRGQFVLDVAHLEREIRAMTDHHTYSLFGADTLPAYAVRASVSRLVVDVERFEDDAAEPMAHRGMGVIYSLGSQGQRLRRDLAPQEREALLARYYRPHHALLDEAVTQALDVHGRCLVLDCHSFPSTALSYEYAGLSTPPRARPDICIGTDGFHTPAALERAFVAAFSGAGWSVAVNDPFAGALVPASRLQRDPRVTAVMVEVNRKLYLDEKDASPRSDFQLLRERVMMCCAQALAQGA
jgi:N-formylglutamate amidohydrolase